MNDLIVGEASVNYTESKTVIETISNLFEEMCRVNKARGYTLHSWKFDRVCISHPMEGSIINETIVAVFEKL